jgi:hypothetical protein
MTAALTGERKAGLPSLLTSPPRQTLDWDSFRPALPPDLRRVEGLAALVDVVVSPILSRLLA